MLRTKLLYPLVLLLAVIFVSDAFGIVRVERRYSFIDFHGGVGIPQGEYDGFPGDFDFEINFRNVDIDADNVYDNGWHLGFNYGQMYAGHWEFSLGFLFTEHSPKDTILLPFDSLYDLTTIDDFAIRQYDFMVNTNFHPLNFERTPFSPYVGVRLTAGIASITADAFDTENDGNVSLGLNFGFDFRFWESRDGLTAVSFVSRNTWDVLASNDRPKYLNIGGGIRYWFKM